LTKIFTTFERAQAAFQEVGMVMSPHEIDMVKEVFDHNQITSKSFAEYADPDKKESRDPRNPFYVLREIGRASSRKFIQNFKHITYAPDDRYTLLSDVPVLHRPPTRTSAETAEQSWRRERGEPKNITGEEQELE
jgi:hypothetical protein